MPYETQTSDFWGWYLRHNNRLVWKHLSDAGIDLFASGPSNNAQAFLDLTNILPAMNGGLNRRWGVSSFYDATESIYPTIVRTFIYNYPQDQNNTSKTANTNLIIGTDNEKFYPFNDTATVYSGYGPSNFSAFGNVWAANSRGYIYYTNGTTTPPRKVNPSWTYSNTDSNIGINIPTVPPGTSCADYPCVRPILSTLESTGGFFYGTTGWGYTSAPTVTVYDISDGSGHDGAITVTINANGAIDSATIADEGSSYTNAYAVVAAPPSGGTQAYLTLYTQQNPNGHRYGSIWGVDLAGPMSFVAGRQYGVALQNSTTGHTSDVAIVSVGNQAITDLPKGPISGPAYMALASVYNQPLAAGGSSAVYPIFVSSINAAGQAVTAGFTQIENLMIQIPDSTYGLDPQVDTVVLLATSDGGDLGTLYEVATIPLSDFTHTGAFYLHAYRDTLPDSFNNSTNIYGTTNTLLAQDLWAETDAAGDSYGITLNQPPPVPFLYPTVHQGRMFATDGKTIFFSKALEEVTTSTALVTSKWEECWPGDYQFGLTYANETVLGMRSDGTNLHIGTDKNIYTLYGNDIESFSVPSTTFQQVGILSNDLWTVVYNEGQPSGFVWVTQDRKIVHSDFSTYTEIGTPIYPVVTNLDLSRIAQMKLLSLTSGPYDFLIFQLFRNGTNGLVEYWIYETRLGKWYRWLGPTQDSNTAPTASILSSFVYQFPETTSSSFSPGSIFLFYYTGTASTYGIHYFNPTAVQDLALYNIAWNVQTSWQDFGDATAIKVMNEIEFTSDDAPLTCTLYGATSQALFDSPSVLRTGTSVAGPIAALGVNKFYTAGAATGSKYYSLAFSPVTPGTSPSVLTSFSAETYPMARI